MESQNIITLLWTKKTELQIAILNLQFWNILEK